MSGLRERLQRLRGWPLWVLGGGIALLCLLAPLGKETDAGLTQEESRISAMLSSIAGAGETRILLYYGGEDSLFGSERAPQGALILSRGAADAGVRLQLLQAVETLLGLPGERVEIYLMEEP